MDVEGMARSQRRRTIGDAIDSERATETALLEQLEEIVAELDGPRVDEEAFARMTPEDADIVRSLFAGQNQGGEELEEDLDEDWLAPAPDPEVERQELVAEIARLKEEIARSRRRREALERYKDALDSESIVESSR